MQEITIQVNDLLLAAKAWGNKNNPKILALHGWLDNAASFDALAALLAADYYVVALDLPGHGISQHYSGEDYPILLMVDYVSAVLKKLDWPQVILLGHSLGGTIASVIAAQRPTQITALISIDAIGPLSKEVLENSAVMKQTEQIILKSKSKPRTAYRSLLQMAERRAKMNQVSVTAIMPLIERGAHEINGHFEWRFDPHLLVRSGSYLTEQIVLDYLAAIQCSVLLIQAEQGLLINSQLVENRKQAFADLTLKILAGGHHLHLDHAPEVYTAITAFLKQISKK